MIKPSQSVPILDVSAIYSSDTDARQALADAFYQAYATAGFCYIKNHGISDTLINELFQASAQFHALPLEQKILVELNQQHRGYIPINTSTDVNSTLAEVTQPNQSESFMVMREDEPDSAPVLAGDYLAGSNQWPELSGFKETVMAYNTAMTSLAQKLIRIVSVSLQADTSFVDAFNLPTTWLRLLHYPSTVEQNSTHLAEQGLYGSAPHTDFGCLTLLAQDDVGGLQVLSEQGDWMDVPRLPGTFVVNAGDMLHRWSNGLLKSTPHRVINASGQPRYSCPFFFDPYVNTIVKPLQSCTSTDRPVSFDAVHFGDFLREELHAGYEHHQQSSNP